MDEGRSGGGGAVPGNQGGGAGDRRDQELRSIIEGGAGEARFQEPTADEREKLAKQARKKQAADEKKFAKLNKAVLKEQRKAGRKARWRRRLRRTAWGVSGAILLGAGVLAYTHFANQGNESGGPNDTRLVTNGAVPPTVTKPLSPLTQSGPPADPFTGSPADKWANGAAGIAIPAAKPHGQYSAAQVESAYQTTKKLLVAASLNQQSVLGGAPTAFADLLTQDQRSQFTSQLNKIGLDKYGDPVSTRGWIVQFAPGTTKLIGSDIKVRGTMSAGAAKQGGDPVLRVTVDYIVVYAVEPPRAPADWMRVVAQFQGHIDFADWAEADTPFEPWWNAGPAVAGIRCGVKDGFIHPDYPSGPPDSSVASGPAVNPYTFGEPSSTGACQPTTGT
jgi:hypothetical protein